MTRNKQATITGEETRQDKPENIVTLSETQSKDILKSYGIPVVNEVVTMSEDQAVLEARKIGFPVVLKGLGANLTHKTETGLVKINLHDEDGIRQAYREIKTSAGDDWEGCLLQPLINGKREFVVGMFREDQFGACVMFGLGGVFTEAFADVVFRITPVNQIQALEMTREIRASKLLGAFRGESAANMAQLSDVITGLSRLAAEHPEIREVDINPLIVMPDGDMVAVDALVVMDENAGNDPVRFRDANEDDRSAAEIRKALDVMTHARSVAVVGAARTKRGNFPGMFGCMRNFGYSGRLYPVNPNVDEIDGLKTYPNLVSLPESVDLVIISVPARLVPDALKDCIASGNRNIHIFSSGFHESQEDEGIQLYAEIEEIARNGGLHVIGPNCMGLYVPANKMLTWAAASDLSGPISMISQSGGNAQEFTHHASNHHRLYFNKVVSYGNALTLDSTDFLDYLSHDDTTDMIAMYIEGVKDGRQLLERVTQTNRVKPVLIFKAGLTESGARAVSSHTGAMAGNRNIWEAFFRQTGAVQVDSVEEMADTAAAFHYLKKTEGRRVAVLTAGGGAGVAVSDTCARAGMEVPAFSPGTVSKIRAFIPPQGNMVRNPIDAMFAFMQLDLLGKIFDILVESEEIDNIIVSLPLDWLYDKEDGVLIKSIAHYLAGEGRARLHGKPLVVVWRQFLPSDEIRKTVTVLKDILLEAGIPVFEGLHRAIGSLSRLADYSDFQKRFFSRD